MKLQINLTGLSFPEVNAKVESLDINLEYGPDEIKALTEMWITLVPQFLQQPETYATKE